MLPESGGGSRSPPRYHAYTAKLRKNSSCSRSSKRRPINPAWPEASTTHDAGISSRPSACSATTPRTRSPSNSTSTTRQPSRTSAPTRWALRSRISSKRSRETWNEVGCRALVSRKYQDQGSRDFPQTIVAPGFSVNPAAATSSSTPKLSKIGSEAGSSDSPTCTRGNTSRSSSTTSLPRIASNAPAVAPPGPPPTTTIGRGDFMTIPPPATRFRGRGPA